MRVQLNIYYLLSTDIDKELLVPSPTYCIYESSSSSLPATAPVYNQLGDALPANDCNDCIDAKDRIDCNDVVATAAKFDIGFCGKKCVDAEKVSVVLVCLVD